jgi:ammonia channel protein AmtB
VNVVVILETVMLLTVLLSLICSIWVKTDEKKLVLICLLFFSGFWVNIIFKHFELLEHWFVTFTGVFALTSLVMAYICKKPTLAEVLIVLILFLGATRNLIAHVYFANGEWLEFRQFYRYSGLILDAVLIALAIGPMMKELIGKLKSVFSNGIFKYSGIARIFRSSDTRSIEKR